MIYKNHTIEFNEICMKKHSTHILVIDLEATCDEGDGLAADDMEVIEIGAVWATAEGEVLEEFQALVRPTLHPISDFCQALTGIQQADVDTAPLFPVVAAQLASFAQRSHDATMWGSWGKFDDKQIQRDCQRHGVASPLPALSHLTSSPP